MDAITNVKLANTSGNGTVDLMVANGHVADIQEHSGSTPVGCLTHMDGGGRLLAQSLCHPHVHLDKAFILGHSRYRHLQIREGTFDEAMKLTSEAKKSFTFEDLLVRGQRLLDESWSAGVTHLRAYVEVDDIVGLTCLKAGAELKRRAQNNRRCYVQLCAFAQLPLKPLHPSGQGIRSLMEQAMEAQYLVDAVGSTPYVEEDDANKRENVRWLIDLALEHQKHIDFHLDYSVDPKDGLLVHHVVEQIKKSQWTSRTIKVVTLAHCTRLIYLSDSEWTKLAADIGDLPVHFVGLPTSDLYMMKRPLTNNKEGTREPEIRGTLPVLQLIQNYNLNAAIGMNNIGNAFTPQGCCDPLYLANLGVAIYQAGKVDDARLLYECVSERARAAIGIASQASSGMTVTTGQPAHFVLFNLPDKDFEAEHNIEDKVYFYKSTGRETIFWP